MTPSVAKELWFPLLILILVVIVIAVDILAAGGKDDAVLTTPTPTPTLYETPNLPPPTQEPTPTHVYLPPATLPLVPPATVTSLGEIAYAALFRQFDWPVGEAMRVCTCENPQRVPTLVSRTADYGLCGINRIHRGRVGGDLMRLLIAKENIRVAYAIWLEQGWYPWRFSYGCHQLR